MRKTLLLSLVLVLVSAGCKKSDDPTSTSPSVSARADSKAGSSASPGNAKPGPVGETAAARAKKACSDFPGYEGKGTFADLCKTKGPAPFTLVWTGEYKKDEYGEVLPAFKITSNFDRDVTWGDVSVWLYDKDGKQIDTKASDGSKLRRYSINGSGVLKLKAGETAELYFGQKKTDVPPEAVTIVAEVTGWGIETEPKLFFAAYSGREDLDDRPKDGLK